MTLPLEPISAICLLQMSDLRIIGKAALKIGATEIGDGQGFLRFVPGVVIQINIFRFLHGKFATKGGIDHQIISANLIVECKPAWRDLSIDKS
ncbi:MAG: hypothetical protein ACI88A_001938 [Paraglaciecola sp.]|jgi:hypothetical protein